MSRFQYHDPPVHEVVLSLGFHDSLDPVDLERLPENIAGRFSRSDRLERTEAEIALGPVGETAVSSQRRFDGWLFKHDDGSRILRTSASLVSYHVVRPGKWPAGPYPGWDIIRPEWVDLLQLLAPAYQLTPIRRSGLRYLNRIAIPEEANPSEWFTVTLRAPSLLRGLFNFNLAQTWARIEGNERLSANIKMAKITIEAPEYAKGHQGVLLDIEVFNLYVKDAPRFTELTEWFNQAHAVENEIFEECVTEALRTRFRKTPEESQ